MDLRLFLLLEQTKIVSLTTLFVIIIIIIIVIVIIIIIINILLLIIIIIIIIIVDIAIDQCQRLFICLLFFSG